MKRKLLKTAAAIAALALTTGLLAACGSDSSSSNNSDSSNSSTNVSSSESSDSASASDTSASDSSADSSSSEPTKAPEEIKSTEWHEGGLVPKTAYVSDEYMDMSTLLGSDNRALADVMKKAQKGEEVTIVCIGGSITQGTISSGEKDSTVPARKYYATFVQEWWEQRFPDTKINFVNAGIGATTSYLGVHRAGTDVLSHEPDLVIVEFAVNDAGLRNGQEIYDNLVRNILTYKSKPAVMLLFMGQTNGSTAQMDEYPVGKAYALPMLSYTNVISRMMKDGTYTAKDLSGDTVHPSALGHSICGELFWY